MAGKKINFETSVARLEEIVRLLESGNVSLDESLKLYAEGTTLVRSCTELLEKAKQKVTVIQENGENDSAEKAGQ